ncbi:hypothetical protein [Mycolicibacterium bacteremicum]|uniref:Uncharacterized protein n=1 Tax=Mycolicibacterium bacteremicum TaxID=564198 RepID=A0A1W9YQC6_MYCBA|nr:hypothetical protein [Mycolicibacterium bacteremicum]MCV7434835.1 hypothetical protein [Mycolicibacterium bacteremicum]ORA02132.1 hypothetical protein BST17_24795 [Mycolicibacterium bacteremicum]
MSELTDLPEPVMVGFDRLPFPMRMRIAADVMDAVNVRFRKECPTVGISQNEPISPSSMRFLADTWQMEDALAAPSNPGDTTHE